MLWNVSGKKLDDYISRAKVILDLHTSEDNKVQANTTFITDKRKVCC